MILIDSTIPVIDLIINDPQSNVQIVAPDTLSQTNGNMDGFTYCGARVYLITVLNPLATLDINTGLLTFNQITDANSTGTTDTIFITVGLASSPSVYVDTQVSV